MGSINQSIPDFETLPEKYGWVTDNGKGYKIKEALFGTERSLKVIALGAGAAGICLAKYLPLQLRNVSLSIYDKNPEFSWAKNPHWSKFYSEGPEILEYFKNVVERFNLSQYINLNHEVIDATWDSDRGQWDIRIKNLLTGIIFTDTCNVFLNCGGILNAWRWPDIEGLNTFQGKLCHTANYDSNTDLKDKRVAVIGIGSSGVQVIPKIVNEVDHLYCWIRSPTWMTSGFAQKYAGPNGENFNYSDEQKQYFAKNSEEYLEYCKNLEIEIHQVFKSVQLGSPESRLAKEFSSKEMKKKLAHRTDIMERIIPTTFEVGCRRPTPGNGFLEALTLDKVTTYLDSVKKITRKGFIDTDGNEQEVDVIICATGFDTSWVPRFPIVANGKNLQDIQWKKPISYLSMAVPGMPNYFTIGGPYFSFGHGSYTTMVELFLDNILSVIKKLQKENIKSMSPQQSATEDFIEHADIWLKRTAWAGPCPSWFKNGTVDGVLTIFPGSRMVLANLLECPRYEDYEIEYLSKNRFSFMGNGFSTKEYDGSDAAWYLGVHHGLLPEAPLAPRPPQADSSL